jgi:hypothetical protein
MLVFGGLMIMNIYSQGSRFITVNYQHSRRIPYNKIDMELKSENDIYQIKVATKQMEGKTGYEYSNRDDVFIIEKSYFDNIYEQLLNLNYREIISNSEDVMGMDGTSLKITIGSHQNNIVLNIWSPDYKSEERRTGHLNAIIEELFKKIGLEEWK